MKKLRVKTKTQGPINTQACRQEHNLAQHIFGEIECGFQPIIGVMCTKCGYAVMFQPIQQQA